MEEYGFSRIPFDFVIRHTTWEKQAIHGARNLCKPFTHNGSSRTSYLFRAVHYLFIVKAVISHGKR